jgi:hypothetical protein
MSFDKMNYFHCLIERSADFLWDSLAANASICMQQIYLTFGTVARMCVMSPLYFPDVAGVPSVLTPT